MLGCFGEKSGKRKVRGWSGSYSLFYILLWFLKAVFITFKNCEGEGDPGESLGARPL